MGRFWGRRRAHDLEDELRRWRPEPPPDLVRRVTERLDDRQPRSPLISLRIALATGLSALLLFSAASIGGVGGVTHGATAVFDTLKSTVAPSRSSQRRTVTKSPGQDQYKPGKGCGDKRKHSPKQGTGSAKKPCRP